MTPTSFHITKFKVASESDGLAATEFGNVQMSDPSKEIEFQEVLLEDITPEQALEIKTGMTLFLKFDNYAIDLPLSTQARRRSGEDTYETYLSSDELVEAEVLEIVDNSQINEGSVLLKIKAFQEFDC